MAKTIPVAFRDAPEIEIDGALVARGFGLGMEAFRQLMDDGKVALLCERGTGEDAGLYRASFYHGTKRVRLVATGDGTVVPDSVSVDEMPVRRSPGESPHA